MTRISLSAPQQRLALVSSHLDATTATNSASAPHHQRRPVSIAPAIAPAEEQAHEAAGSNVKMALRPARPQAPRADEFRFFLPFQTRWADNDMYSHANNVVYSLYFDSITNFYLINHVPRPTPSSPAPLGLIVSSSTAYASSVAYPSPVIAALAVSSVGKSSVTWRVALFEAEYGEPLSGGCGGEGEGASRVGLAGFGLESIQGGQGVGRPVRLKRDAKTGEQVRAAAYGDMVHVFVDPESRRPLPNGMSDEVRTALEKLRVDA